MTRDIFYSMRAERQHVPCKEDTPCDIFRPPGEKESTSRATSGMTRDIFCSIHAERQHVPCKEDTPCDIFWPPGGKGEHVGGNRIKKVVSAYNDWEAVDRYGTV